MRTVKVTTRDESGNRIVKTFEVEDPRNQIYERLPLVERRMARDEETADPERPLRFDEMSDYTLVREYRQAARIKPQTHGDYEQIEGYKTGLMTELERRGYGEGEDGDVVDCALLAALHYWLTVGGAISDIEALQADRKLRSWKIAYLHNAVVRKRYVLTAVHEVDRAFIKKLMADWRDVHTRQALSMMDEVFQYVFGPREGE